MRYLALLVSVLLAFPFLGCSSGSDASGMKPSSSQDKGKSSDTADSAQGAITVTQQEQRVAGILLARLEPRMVPRTLTVPGQIMMDAEHTAQVAPYFDGQVAEVLRQPGDFVQRGEVLARFHSHAAHETVGALAQDFANVVRAQSAVTFAQQKQLRYNHLYAIEAASLEQKQASDQELVQSQTALADAQAAVIMEREHLADLLHVAPSSITPANLYSFETLPLVAPISGTVITRSITPGMVLTQGTEAYTLSNLSQVWLIAQVNQANLMHLQIGQPVQIHTDAWPGKAFSGHVTLIGSTLDPVTRTVQVRATLPNPQRQLKPMMYATAVIDEGDTPPVTALFVPEDAIQQINGVPAVFVTEDGTHFHSSAVQTLPPVHGQVEVTAGLHAGQTIAVAGTFMLKSAMMKSSLGSD